MATIDPDMVDLMMEWENGTIDEDDEYQLFQHLVNTGLA